MTHDSSSIADSIAFLFWQVHYNEFISLHNQQYPTHPWETVQVCQTAKSSVPPHCYCHLLPWPECHLLNACGAVQGCVLSPSPCRHSPLCTGSGDHVVVVVGLSADPSLLQCRAIYAVDLMLEWNRATEPCPGIQPKLLEVNYSPDCIRACRYHPSFFNHVFETLFLDSSAWSQDLPITKLL